MLTRILRAFERIGNTFAADAIALLGIVAILKGVSMWSVAASWIIAGVVIVYVAMILARRERGP